MIHRLIHIAWLLLAVGPVAGCNWNPTLEVLPERHAMGTPEVFKGEQLIRLVGIERADRVYRHNFMQMFTQTYREDDTVVIVDVFEFKYPDDARRAFTALAGIELPPAFAATASSPTQCLVVPRHTAEMSVYWMISGRCTVRLVQTALSADSTAAAPEAVPPPEPTAAEPPPRSAQLVNRLAWQLHREIPMLYQFK